MALGLVSSLLAADEFMPLSELRPGMKGQGRTVYSGARIGTFDVEVIDIVPKFTMGRDMILVRCSGVDLEKTGVAGGMSGSPVFIGGRLVGALSSGWALSKDSIAGLTPIHDMLSLFEAETRVKPGSHPPSGKSEKGPPEIAPVRPSGPFSLGGPPPVSPIATPLYLSGFHPQALESIKSKLARWNLVPVTGNGAGSGSAGPMPHLTAGSLEPGSALSVIIADGDLTAAAIGTLTYRKGDRLIAFGHPLLSAGPTSLPIGTGLVHVIIHSYLMSFKLASAVEPVGVIDYDSFDGVRGRLGVEPKWTLLEMRMTGMGPALSRHARFARQRDLLRTFLPASIASLILEEVRVVGPVTIRSQISVELTDGRRLKLTGIASSRDHPLGAVGELLDPLQQFLDNPLAPADPVRVQVEFEVAAESRTATLDSVRVNKSRLRPGETLELTCISRAFGGQFASKTTTFTLPDDLEPGPVTLEVLDAAAALQKDRQRNPARYNPKDLPALIKLLSTERLSSSLYARLALPREGVTLEGRELPSLPGSLLTLFSTPSASGASKLTTDLEVEIPTDWVQTGQEALNLEILPEVER